MPGHRSTLAKRPHNATDQVSFGELNRVWKAPLGGYLGHTAFGDSRLLMEYPWPSDVDPFALASLRSDCRRDLPPGSDLLLMNNSPRRDFVSVEPSIVGADEQPMCEPVQPSTPPKRRIRRRMDRYDVIGAVIVDLLPRYGWFIFCSHSSFGQCP
jgi:hypothetical protein